MSSSRSLGPRSEELVKITRECLRTISYIDGKAQANAYSACNGAFACAVWTKYHVHAGSWGELHKIVGEKVLAAYSRYGAWQVTRHILTALVSIVPFHSISALAETTEGIAKPVANGLWD